MVFPIVLEVLVRAHGSPPRADGTELGKKTMFMFTGMIKFEKETEEPEDSQEGGGAHAGHTRN